MGVECSARAFHCVSLVNPSLLMPNEGLRWHKLLINLAHYVEINKQYDPFFKSHIHNKDRHLSLLHISFRQLLILCFSLLTTRVFACPATLHAHSDGRSLTAEALENQRQIGESLSL